MRSAPFKPVSSDVSRSHQRGALARCVFVAVSALVAVVLSSGEAAATYTLCNKTSYVLDSAMAFIDDQENLISSGWWRLLPGKCKVALSEVSPPGPYFVYAESIEGHRGPRKTWSGSSDENAFCVENEGMWRINNQEQCAGDLDRKRAFVSVEIQPSAEGLWQTDFVEEANFTAYSAVVAGVKRLLIDAGVKEKLPGVKVDPRDDTITVNKARGIRLGRETRYAINSFRSSKGLGNGSVDDQLVLELIEDAQAREAKVGFWFCNKTDAPVWSAIGQPVESEDYSTRGWWRLDSGACTKVIKGKLISDHYYVHGVIETQNDGERRLRPEAADKLLCVDAVMFDTTGGEDCSAKDFEAVSFRRIDVGGEAVATFNFEPAMFVEATAGP